MIYDKEVKNRLVQSPDDNAHIIKNGFAIWNNHLSAFEDHFADNLEVIDVAGVTIGDLKRYLAGKIYNNHVRGGQLFQ